jgi:hypothetical protein
VVAHLLGGQTPEQQVQQPVTKLMAKIAFGGDGDPDLAVAAPEQLGYTVFRLPPEYKERLLDPLDSCLEAIIESRNDDKAIRAIMDERHEYRR